MCEQCDLIQAQLNEANRMDHRPARYREYQLSPRAQVTRI